MTTIIMYYGIEVVYANMPKLKQLHLPSKVSRAVLCIFSLTDSQPRTLVSEKRRIIKQGVTCFLEKTSL